MRIFQSGFHAALVADSGRSVAVPAVTAVQPIANAADMEDFLTAYVAGWSIPPAAHDQFKANVRPWFGQPGWTLYVARIDGRPAAAATLFVHDGIGYFADASTDPAFRRRGLHSALLRRRLHDASLEGVACVCSGADFLSTSHRNMERIGMQLLFLRAIWTPL